LPRPEDNTLARIPVNDPWFEVYQPAPGVFAIYEPHQWEEIIGYLIVGEKRALQFDIGMGIGDIKKVTVELTSLPSIILDSHTHPDHVGGNWEFDTVYGMDTEFARRNAKGSREAPQAEIAPGHICGTLPQEFDPNTYATRPWKNQRVHSRRRPLRPGRPHDGSHRYTRPHPGRDFADGPRQRTAFHRRHVLPRNDLPLFARNTPVASPTVLPRLASAFNSVRAGKSTLTPDSPGYAIYKVYDFSFLMRAPVAHLIAKATASVFAGGKLTRHPPATLVAAREYYPDR